VQSLVVRAQTVVQVERVDLHMVEDLLDLPTLQF
jgi:hypothetical protein